MIGRTVSRPRDRRRFRRFRERVGRVFRRLIPFRGNCAWETQVGAWVFQIKHPESTVTLANGRGTWVMGGSRLTIWIWKDPHWWGMK